MTAQPTCAERLPSYLASRLADLRAILDRDDPDEGDDELPPMNEYGLALDVRYAIRFELSTGGPADYITATVDGGEIESAEYHFADWFDHAERALRDDELDTVSEYLARLVDLSDLAGMADR